MDSKTKTKHTPGPWEWGDLPGGRFTNELVVRPAGEFPHGEWIADVGSRYDDERRANAALIAAAPDLLAAAQAALEDRLGWRRELRRAVEKATGAEA